MPVITWKLTIDLILETFGINQQELASLLGVGKSTLSRLKNGKQRPLITPEVVFYNVFDPDNKNSPAKDTPNNLLENLKDTIEYPQYQEIRKVMDDLWDKTDYKKFVEMLIQRTSYGPKFQVKTANMPNPNNTKTRSEQLQELFLRTIQAYKIMDIINRKPAVFNLNDSVCLNNFLRDTGTLLPAYNSCDALLRTSIESFSNSLQIQALTIEATLNNRFRFDGENATVNMEDSDIDPVKTAEIKNRLELPEFSLELVESVQDRLHLLKIGLSEWGNFRNEMNGLFDRIRTWSGEATE